MPYAAKLTEETKVRLSSVDPSTTHDVAEEVGREEALKLQTELGELQELLYAAATHSVLIVLQGMDTSGKDGTISHVFDAVNPQSVSVASFKQPTPLESAHDFLWRVHQKTPPKGMMSIFNRSHYEDVLVVRVHKLVPHSVWEKRYEQINHFESLLSGCSTIILKFYLHISSDEQERRLLAREEDVSKGWKLSPGDWKERLLWDDYMKAYESVLERTATVHAPWYLVPANHKWFRNLAVAEAIVTELRKYKDEWNKRLDQVSEQARAELAQMRGEPSGKAPVRAPAPPSGTGGAA